MLNDAAFEPAHVTTPAFWRRRILLTTRRKPLRPVGRNVIAGLFGMNVGGIPLAQHARGFWIVVGVASALIAGVRLVVRRRGDCRAPHGPSGANLRAGAADRACDAPRTVRRSRSRGPRT